MTTEIAVDKQAWKAQAAKLAQSRWGRLAIRMGTLLTVPRQRIGVVLVALNEDNEVLMLRHVFHPHFKWGLPGGWLKKNEAPAAGVLRELREETGLKAVLGPAISVQHDTQTAHVGIAYVGQIKSGRLQLSHEIMEARWFPYRALPQPITHHTQLAIKAAVAHQMKLG